MQEMKTLHYTKKNLKIYGVLTFKCMKNEGRNVGKIIKIFTQKNLISSAQFLLPVFISKLLP
jgi:hypothetical protein